MKQHLFAEPNHKIQSAIPILPGVFDVIASFFFKGDGANYSRICFFAMGVGLILLGCAEFLPRGSTTIAGIFRILALAGILVGFIVLIFGIYQ
jgi:hypothetical protein